MQVFDSWVGALDRDDYRRFVLPHMTRVFEVIAGTGVPAIHSGVGTGHLLELMREAGGDALGVDHRLPLDVAWATIGHDRAIQGNLDPALSPRPVGRRRAEGPGRARSSTTTGTDTCSTSATACSPTRRWSISSGWSTWFTRRRSGPGRDRADRCVGHGLRHRERTGGHRALLHGHPWRTGALAGASRRAEGSVRGRSATCSRCGTRQMLRRRDWSLGCKETGPRTARISG